MKIEFARMTITSLLVVVFGIFFITSCSVIQPANTDHQEYYSNQEYELALESIQSEIRDNPENIELRLTEMDILKALSEKQESSKQKEPYYREMRDIATVVGQSGTSDEVSKSNQLLIDAWTTEQQTGIEFLQQDSSVNYDQNYQEAIAAFDNSILLISDSLSSYNLKATTYYKHGDIDLSIEAMEQAYEEVDGQNEVILERLAFLYLEAGFTEKSIQKYNELINTFGDKRKYLHGLINGYILTNQHEEAMDVLFNLIEDYPSDSSYKLALATQLAEQSNQYLRTISRQNVSSDELNQIRENTEKTESIFKELYDQKPPKTDVAEQFAAFYKNTSVHLIDISEQFNLISFKEYADTLLEKSIPVWQYLAESNPDNLDVLKNLNQIYLTLGMPDEADAIERSINY